MTFFNSSKIFCLDAKEASRNVRQKEKKRNRKEKKRKEKGKKEKKTK